METLGEFVLDQRQARNMNVTEFGRYTGIKHQTLSKWERGEIGGDDGYPDVKTLIKLSRATGTSLATIVLLLVPKEERGSVSADAWFVGEQIEQLPREAREFIKITVAALVRQNINQIANDNKLLHS